MQAASSTSSTFFQGPAWAGQRPGGLRRRGVSGCRAAGHRAGGSPDASSATAHARAVTEELDRGAELAGMSTPVLVVEAPADPAYPPLNAEHLERPSVLRSGCRCRARATRFLMPCWSPFVTWWRPTSRPSTPAPHLPAEPGDQDGTPPEAVMPPAVPVGERPTARGIRAVHGSPKSIGAP